MITNTIRRDKIFNKVIVCAKLDNNTLNDLISLNLLHDHAVLKLLDGLSEFKLVRRPLCSKSNYTILTC